MIYRLLLPVPFRVRGKNAGKQVPFVTGNTHDDPRTRRYRTKAHRALAAKHAMDIRLSLGVPQVTGHVVLRGTLIKGPRQRLSDVEGVYAALKPAKDGLRDAGWIVDDNPRWCDYSATQVIDRRLGPAVMFEITLSEEPPETRP